MPHRQRNAPSDQENFIPPTSSPHIALNHGRLEAWFEGHEDRIQTFLIEITRKQIIILIRDHVMKAQRLTDFNLPYVVLISKFIEHFGVDVEGELEESTGC